MSEDFKGIVGLYFEEISKLKTYTDLEILNLFKRLRQGDLTAQSEIAKANLKLVISIAKKYIGLSTGLQFSDLIGEGNKGLFKAIQKFDLDRGCHFSTYATIWIRQYILRGIAKQGKIVRPAINRCYRSNKISRILRNIPCGEPTNNILKILKRSGIKNSDIRKFLIEKDDFVHTEIYFQNLDFLLKDDERTNTTPFDLMCLNDMSRLLNLAKKALNNEERRVIEYRFGQKTKRKTLEEIGQIFDVTRERIRQIEAIALKKMRIYFEKKNIFSLSDIK